MGRIRFIALLLILTGFLVARAGEARHRGGGHFHGLGFHGEGWNHGYWFHGAYHGWAGWWWIVGPSWYYYPNPTYPFPADAAEASHVAEFPGAPPPPPSASSDSAPAVSGGEPSLVKAMSYYCEKNKGYFPTVRECADGWIAVPTEEKKVEAVFSYYCDADKEYYPRLQKCASGWIAVPADASPPPASPIAPPPATSPTSEEVVTTRPNVFSLEFLGRALLYSVNFDRAISDHLSLGLGISSWPAAARWDGYEATVTLIPIYANFYFSTEPARGFFSAGADIILVGQSIGDNGIVTTSGAAAVIGGGYESREDTGFLFRAGGYVIIRQDVIVSPALSLGYTF